MNIKLLKLGWMTTSGSGLLGMIQNVSTPNLDLIVRESIQNSMDAVLPTAKNVKVFFRYDSFDVESLSNEFEEIGDKFKSLKFDNGYKFLSITDTNTIGLNGNLNGIFMPNESNQNLGKLVFQIMKAQSTEGAGGSWGIGKTVYYRLGIGLNIYYSRTKVGDKYQNRLVAALVEDEKRQDGLLSMYGNKNLGAAFFGEIKEDGYNDLCAITDDTYIEKFLNIFGLKPFTGNQTGTTIIIPFIDEKKVLSNASIEGENDVWWGQDIEEYLKLSILRWYYPRMANKYPFGAKLIAYVNDEPVSANNETPIFTRLKALYDAAWSKDKPDWINKEAIIRNRELKDKVIGWFLWCKIPKKDMINNNLPLPYNYVLSSNSSSEFAPIIAYCRKPGMITTYKTEWSIHDSNDFIIGMFVLNSNNEIKIPCQINLDEYIRKGEKSDHMLWYDHAVNNEGKMIRIVELINNSIRSILEKNYGKQSVVSGQGQLNTILAHKYGRKFLPDENYGNGNSNKGRGGNRGGGGVLHKDSIAEVEFISKTFSSKCVNLNYSVSLKKKVSSIKIYSVINTTSSKDCTAEKWEQNGPSFPLSINAFAIRCTSINGKKVEESPVFKTNGIVKFKFFDVSTLVSNHGKVYGLEFNSNDECNDLINFDLRIAFSSMDKLIQSNFKFEFKEE